VYIELETIPVFGGRQEDSDYAEEMIMVRTLVGVLALALLLAGTAMAGQGGADFWKSTAQPKDDAEKKILDVLGDLHENQRRGMMNVPVDDGRLLRMLTETIGAKHVVEIGTSNGYSGIWFMLALRTTGGKLTTYEIDEGRAKLARENFKRAGVEHLVTLVMGDAHKEIVKLKEPIDILFLDADKTGYIDYLDKFTVSLACKGQGDDEYSQQLIWRFEHKSVLVEFLDDLQRVSENPLLFDDETMGPGLNHLLNELIP